MSIEQRFAEKTEEVPGPGNYEVSNKVNFSPSEFIDSNRNQGSLNEKDIWELCGKL